LRIGPYTIDMNHVAMPTPTFSVPEPPTSLNAKFSQ
jgi:hypothetical protein